MRISTKLGLATLLFGALALRGTASFAQPAAGEGDKPDHGYAPPSDEGPPPAGTTEGEGHGGGTGGGHGDGTGGGHGEHAEGHGDPTRHFNFLNFSYRGKDELGGPMGDGKMVDPETGKIVSTEEEPMSAPFILMVFNFALLLALLIWKGKPAAHKIAEERHDQIATALAEAAKLRKQAADKLAEYETKLKDADAEIKAMVEGMRKDAETDKARILDNAAKQSATMQRDAEARIAAEIEYARAALTREVTAAASAATEKLLRDKLQPTDQSALVSTFINDVQAASAVSLKERS